MIFQACDLFAIMKPGQSFKVEWKPNVTLFTKLFY